MFRKLQPPATAVTIFVDGQPVSADVVDSVAAVLLATPDLDGEAFRRPVQQHQPSIKRGKACNKGSGV